MNYDPLIRICTDEKMYGLLEIMQTISELKPVNAKAKELPMQTIKCLFYIANHDGCHKQALEEDLNRIKLVEVEIQIGYLLIIGLQKGWIRTYIKNADLSDRRRDRLFNK